MGLFCCIKDQTVDCMNRWTFEMLNSCQTVIHRDCWFCWPWGIFRVHFNYIYLVSALQIIDLLQIYRLASATEQPSPQGSESVPAYQIALWWGRICDTSSEACFGKKAQTPSRNNLQKSSVKTLSLLGTIQCWRKNRRQAPGFMCICARALS